MSRHLLILRHAKSDWDAEVAGDFDRPLARRGRKAATAMGSWLAAHGLLPDLLFASPARRAKETARRLCRAASLPEEAITWRPELYGAKGETVLALVAGTPERCGRVMVIGHNPGLAVLLHHLAGTELSIPADGKVLPTAALALLAVNGAWADLAPATTRLVSLTRPREVMRGGEG